MMEMAEGDETISAGESHGHNLLENLVCEALDLLHIDVEPETTKVAHMGCEESKCSKNVMRKQRHWERKLAAKKNKRREEKLRRKQKRAGDSGCGAPHLHYSKRVVKAITRERLTGAMATGTRLCVDLSMTPCMSHKEISRLAGQIRRLYGSNRRSAKPFHLYLTGLQEDSLLLAECRRMNDGFCNYAMEVTEDDVLDLFAQETVVYLTPDAEQALESVDPDEVYVLGGLVDESIQKKLSFLRAREAGVRCARLPIDEYMVKKPNAKNFHSKILAINQVFDILLRFREAGSWPTALTSGIPPAKGYMVAMETTGDVSN